MRANPLPSVALAAVAALAGCGGPILFADLDLPSVQVTLPQVTFTGTGGLPTPPATDVSVDVGANVPVINEKGVTYDLTLNRMTMVLRTTQPGDPTSFDGVDTITIKAIAPASDPGIGDLTLLTWTNPHTATDLTTVTASSQTGADLRRWLDAGQITIEIGYAGSALPTFDWTADLTADFHLQVTLDYGAYL